MKSSRALTGALIVGSVAIASMFAAAPASAATLPAGQKITVVDQWDDQFYTASPSTAVATPVGMPDPIEDSVEGIDVDDTGLGYAVATYYDSDPIPRVAPAPEDDAKVEALSAGYGYPIGGYVYKADANTGKLTDGKAVLIDFPASWEWENDYADGCTAIDYSKGVIVAYCYFAGFEEIDGFIGTVDVSGADAVLTPIVEARYEGDQLYITAIAQNPITGAWWAFDDYHSELFSFSLTDGTMSYAGDVDGYGVYGADFDRSGQLWLSVVEYKASVAALNPTYLELATFNFTDNSVLPVGYYASEDPYFIDTPYALTVWGALAATGSTVMPVAPAVAAGAALLLGAILAAGTMVLRRRNDATA